MAILISNLSKFVEDRTPFLEDIIGGDFMDWPEVGSMFLNQKSMSSGWTDIGTRSNLGAFAVKEETGEQVEDVYLIGPQMRIKAVEYGKRVPTSRIALEDSRDFKEASGMLAGISKDIRESADRTKEILAHDILNSSSYLTPDGIALFSASHVNLQGDTFTNLSPGALGESTLESAILALDAMTDDRGFPIKHTAMKLIVPRQLRFTAERILGTDRTLGSNNNDINMMALQNLQLVVSPYLTDANDWFLQASDHELNWYTRESLRTWVDTNDNRGITEQGATFRSAVGAGDPRGIIKSVNA